MKIDIKALNYACHQHGVQCEVKDETLEVNRKEYALAGKVVLKRGTEAEYIGEENLNAIATLLPSSKAYDVIQTYTKVLMVKLAYCRTEVTEVEPL
jgi:RNA 3'-terminal phosphate cyclase